MTEQFYTRLADLLDNGELELSRRLQSGSKQFEPFGTLTIMGDDITTHYADFRSQTDPKKTFAQALEIPPAAIPPQFYSYESAWGAGQRIGMQGTNGQYAIGVHAKLFGAQVFIARPATRDTLEQTFTDVAHRLRGYYPVVDIEEWNQPEIIAANPWLNKPLRATQ